MNRKKSTTDKIVQILKDNQPRKLTTREIVTTLLERFPEDYQEKRQCYATEEKFMNQMCAENSWMRLKSVHHLLRCERSDTLKRHVFWYEPQETAEIDDDDEEAIVNETGYHERDLHPLLSYFLKYSGNFDAYSKTIFHEDSKKGKKGEDQWLYPDMVAANFGYAGFQENVLKFIQEFDQKPLKIFSFELKKELTTTNFKKYFFQAVSNSSWAHEGYLVTADIRDQDGKLVEALQKLSQSFGIGIIHLNVNGEHIMESQIISPARIKEKLDFAVVDELARKNPQHFGQFLQTISEYDPKNASRYQNEFDKVLSKEELDDYLSDKLC